VIDLHCHVLPGIDDGPDTLEGSVALARAAAAAGVHAIVATPHVSWRYRNDAATIARALGELREARQPPSGKRGRRLNLLYGAQVRVRPPRFRLSVNDPGLVTRDYGYWVENQLRERFALQGVPVSIDFVSRG